MSVSNKKAGQRITAEAPVRIHLIGEHTDYNDGFVLPAAIDKKLTVRLCSNDTDSTVHLTAADLNASFSFDLNDFHPLREGWQNYVMGVVRELQRSCATLSGFDASFYSEVPIGGGMSSSAAPETAFALALNELFDLGLDKWQLIKASQMAEHHFAGIHCGIMDQFASVMGRKDQVMLLDCRSHEFQYYPLELGDYRLLLLNSNQSHALASSAYNQRRRECEEGVAVLAREKARIVNL